MSPASPESQFQFTIEVDSYIIDVVADTSYKYLSNCCCIFNPNKSGAGDENWNVQVGSVVTIVFKVFFTWKYIKIIIFLFLKIIFDIGTLKLSKKTKIILILN